MQRGLFKIGCAIQSHAYEVIIIGLILFGICCAGLPKVRIETDIVKLWVSSKLACCRNNCAWAFKMRCIIYHRFFFMTVCLAEAGRLLAVISYDRLSCFESIARRLIAINKLALSFQPQNGGKTMMKRKKNRCRCAYSLSHHSFTRCASIIFENSPYVLPTERTPD